MVCCLILTRLLSAAVGRFRPTGAVAHHCGLRPSRRETVALLGELLLLALAVVALGAVLAAHPAADMGPSSGAVTLPSAPDLHLTGHAGHGSGNDPVAGPLLALSNHLVWMGLLCLAAMVVPVVLLGLSARGSGALLRLTTHPAVAAAGVWVALVLLWHVPAVHMAAAMSLPLTVGLMAVTVVLSLPFWAHLRQLLRPSTAAAPRRTWLPLGIALEIEMVLGFAMIVLPASMMGASLAEQRLAGALMVAVDLGVLLHLTRRSGWSHHLLVPPRTAPPAPCPARPAGPGDRRRDGQRLTSATTSSTIATSGGTAWIAAARALDRSERISTSPAASIEPVPMNTAVAPAAVAPAPRSTSPTTTSIVRNRL